MFVLEGINTYVNNHCAINTIILWRLKNKKQDLSINGSVVVMKLSILNNQVIHNKFTFMVNILLKPVVDGYAGPGSNGGRNFATKDRV